MPSQVNLIGNPLSIGGLDGREGKQGTPCEMWSCVETAKSELMQLTKTSIMASKRTFVCWVILIGTWLLCNRRRIWSGRGVSLIVRVLRWWGSSISIVVGLHMALIIRRRSRTRIVVRGIAWCLVTRTTSSATVTASSTRATPVTIESMGSICTASRGAAPAARILVTSAVWVMSIHRLSRKHLLRGKRIPTTRVCGSLKKYSDNGKN